MPAFQSLSDEDLQHLLELLKGADSVELKLTVPASGQRSAMAALDIDALDAQVRQVYFFDTPSLDLNEAGVVVRARRVQGKGGDSVVKLRPIAPDDLPAEFRASPNVGVEVDAMPGGFVCSASLKGKGGINDARETAHGQRPIRKLFTKEQRAFYALPRAERTRTRRSLAPRPDLRVEGQVRTPGVRAADGRRAVAVSGRLSHRRAVDEVRANGGVPGRRRDPAVPGRRGIDLGSEQQTKTKTALEFFASELTG